MMSLTHTLLYSTRSCTGPLVRGWQGGSIAFAIACFSPVVLAETLEQACDAAIVSSFRFEAAHRLSDSAAKSLSAARGPRLPRSTLKSSYTELDNEPKAKLILPSLPVNLFPLADDRSLSCQAAIHLPLYTGGRLDRGIEVAQRNVSGLTSHAEDVQRRFSKGFEHKDLILNRTNP